jgi:MFS family permease
MSVAARGPCDEAILLGAPQAAAVAPGASRWTLAATVLGSGMAFLDGSVINVALPVIQKNLGASAAAAQWVVEAYALFLSSLVLAGGSLSDRFGRRRMFEIGVALFAATSAACGMAGGPALLVAARAAQGIAAALLVPSSLALLGAGFPAGERGRAVGSWSALTAIASAVGPVFGGWLVEAVSWRAVFFINLPIAAIVLAISRTKVAEAAIPTRKARPSRRLSGHGRSRRARVRTDRVGRAGLVGLPRLGLSRPARRRCGFGAVERGATIPWRASLSFASGRSPRQTSSPSFSTRRSERPSISSPSISSRCADTRRRRPARRSSPSC